MSSPLAAPAGARRTVVRGGGAWLALLGLVGALGLLWLLRLPDGPAVDRLSLVELAAQAVPLSGIPDPRVERHLVAVTGPLHAAAPLGDPDLLRAGDYIEIWRQVEVFAYREEIDSLGRAQPPAGVDRRPAGRSRDAAARKLQEPDPRAAQRSDQRAAGLGGALPLPAAQGAAPRHDRLVPDRRADGAQGSPGGAGRRQAVSRR